MTTVIPWAANILRVYKLSPQLRELLKTIDMFFELIQKSSAITSYTLHDLFHRMELLKM
jgi:hypothetical protein